MLVRVLSLVGLRLSFARWLQLDNSPIQHSPSAEFSPIEAEGLRASSLRTPPHLLSTGCWSLPLLGTGEEKAGRWTLLFVQVPLLKYNMGRSLFPPMGGEKMSDKSESKPRPYVPSWIDRFNVWVT